jgi:hypothetical protein
MVEHRSAKCSRLRLQLAVALHMERRVRANGELRYTTRSVDPEERLAIPILRSSLRSPSKQHALLNRRARNAVVP